MTIPPPANEARNATPTRVAFCITELDPGGAEKALFETVSRLSRQDWNPRLFCLGGETALADRFRDAGIEVVCYGATSTKLLATIWRLRADLRAFQPAVLATSLFHANFVGRLAAWRTGIPVIAGHRVAERHARWHLVLERFTGRLVSHHVAVSEAVRSFLIEKSIATAENSSVIYNGVDIARFRSAMPANYTAPGPVVLFVGRLSPQKGLETLFDAWRIVTTKTPDMRLVIAGVGPLESLVRAEAKAETVDFIGFQDEIAPWYARADVVVLPSRWEGLPNVLLESLASGTPCVIADVEGVDEVFGDDRSTIVEPCDGVTLASTLQSVLARLVSDSDSGDPPQVTCVERFTWQEAASRTAVVLRLHADF